MTVDPKNDARYQRGYVPDADSAELTASLPPAAYSQPAASIGETEIGSAPDADAEELLDQFEPRNPFIIALWVIGPALIVGGLMLQIRNFLDSFANNYGPVGGDVPFEMLMAQMAWFVGPAMTSTGMAAVVGLLFYQAVRWRSRSTHR
jgi:hypothetical protein